MAVCRGTCWSDRLPVRTPHGPHYPAPQHPQRPAAALDQHVFITGANGFIGRAMMERFRELGATVTGVDLVADPENGVVAGDTTAPETRSEALDGVDVVVHTAALRGASYSLARPWYVNVFGTHQVHRAAIDAGLRRFVHFS